MVVVVTAALGVTAGLFLGRRYAQRPAQPKSGANPLGLIAAEIQTYEQQHPSGSPRQSQPALDEPAAPPSDVSRQPAAAPIPVPPRALAPPVPESLSPMQDGSPTETSPSSDATGRPAAPPVPDDLVPWVRVLREGVEAFERRKAAQTAADAGGVPAERFGIIRTPDMIAFRKKRARPADKVSPPEVAFNAMIEGRLRRARAAEQRESSAQVAATRPKRARSMPHQSARIWKVDEAARPALPGPSMRPAAPPVRAAPGAPLERSFPGADDVDASAVRFGRDL